MTGPQAAGALFQTRYPVCSPSKPACSRTLQVQLSPRCVFNAPEKEGMNNLNSVPVAL